MAVRPVSFEFNNFGLSLSYDPLTVDSSGDVFGQKGASALFCATEITQPSIEGGDKIDITCLTNLQFSTSINKKLKTLTDLEIKGTYDPMLMVQILDPLVGINKNQKITLTHLNGDTLVVWGFLKMYKPAESTKDEGESIMNLTYVITNTDDSQAEAGPVYTPKDV